jgi:hypothetical protein
MGPHVLGDGGPGQRDPDLLQLTKDVGRSHGRHPAPGAALALQESLQGAPLPLSPDDPAAEVPE